MLVAGFASLILFGQTWGGYAAYVAAIAARFGFCLITQMFFARFAAMGKTTAVQSFGLGWIFVHLGDFLGILLFIAVGQGVGASLFTAVQVAALSIVVLVVVTMFVLNDERSFSPGSVAAESLKSYAPASEEFCSMPQGATEGDAVQKGTEATATVDELRLRILALARQHELTPREVEVFDLLARGRSIPYVRDALVISKETAATHAKHVYAKLDVHSRQELIDLVH